MKFKANGIMQSCPRFTTDIKTGPIDIEGTAGGILEGEVGNIGVSVKEIPIRLTIPFLKRKKRLTVVASIGGFKVKVNPFGVKMEISDVKMKGILGTNGIELKADTHVTCKTEMKVKGEVHGKAGVLHLDFGDEDIDFDEPECE